MSWISLHCTNHTDLSFHCFSAKARAALRYHCAMLNIQNLTYLQGGIPLLQQANLQVFANQRIGLVGKNGCRKSTLFQLIRGEIKSDGWRMK